MWLLLLLLLLPLPLRMATHRSSNAATAAIGFATNNMTQSERTLDRLLADANEAHAQVEKLLSERPKAQREREREAAQTRRERDELIRNIEQASSSAIGAPAYMPPQQSPRLPNFEQLAAAPIAQRSLPPPPSSPPHAPPMHRAIARYAARREYAIEKKMVSTGLREAHESRRLERELQYSAERIRELEVENGALLARAEAAESSTLSADLDGSRQRCNMLEQQVLVQAHTIDDLRFQLREAVAERERLRTLLAGTVWFDAENRDKITWEERKMADLEEAQ